MKYKYTKYIWMVLSVLGLFALTGTLNAQTVPGPEVVQPVLDQLVSWNNALLGLPALPLVILGAIMVGYFCKLLPVISNKFIPTIVFSFAVAAYLGMTPLEGVRDWTRAIILGLSAGGASIFIHRKWLRSWIDIDVFGPTVPLIFFVGFLAYSATGCSWYKLSDLKPVPVAKGQDPVVVNAERVQTTSLAVFKEVTEWELAYRVSLPVAVSRATDAARKEFPSAWRESRKALAEYKQFRGVSTNALDRTTAALKATEAALLRLKSHSDPESVVSVFSTLRSLADSIAMLRRPPVVQP